MFRSISSPISLNPCQGKQISIHLIVVSIRDIPRIRLPPQNYPYLQEKGLKVLKLLTIVNVPPPLLSGVPMCLEESVSEKILFC